MKKITSADELEGKQFTTGVLQVIFIHANPQMNYIIRHIYKLCKQSAHVYLLIFPHQAFIRM